MASASKGFNIVKLAIAQKDVEAQLVPGLTMGGSALAAELEKPWYLNSEGKFAILSHTGVKAAVAAGKAEASAAGGRPSVPSQLSGAQTKEEAA